MELTISEYNSQNTLRPSLSFLGNNQTARRSRLSLLTSKSEHSNSGLVDIEEHGGYILRISPEKLSVEELSNKIDDLYNQIFSPAVPCDKMLSTEFESSSIIKLEQIKENQTEFAQLNTNLSNLGVHILDMIAMRNNEVN